MYVDLLSEIPYIKIEVIYLCGCFKFFSKNLRKYRNESGLSQEAFANKAGLHRTYISALERGKRSVALDNIEKIADALGIDAYLLFIDIPNETSTDIK